ncbi:DUF2474 family protein [Gallaecimonas pentaromativorans]|uniref:Uncharacterized protein DUF2474 n=1 Tax=Gallaecimonas pentaromativorans TaxID=584787 RepID=A0A3N1NWT1_9GAMM|nr:DUF2474 family protein [Gallaecimonas pentaromativorans]MED5526878.1 DUF2474 family protein [Pseudomonadota bacterium]ROQ23342.1 uncharacterized protein DUF2474 [Gallaecimonas pentaromativorans]
MLKQKWFWFVGLYFGSVVALSVVAYGLRWLLS